MFAAGRAESSIASEMVGTMNLVIREESPRDFHAIAEVHRRAFGQEAEAALVDGLRAGGWSRVSLVAEVEDRIVGHVLFSGITIRTETAAIEALSLAPLAVLPAWQRRGIGSRLIADGLRRCREAGHRAVLVLGHPDFYPRFGFSAERAEPLSSPFGGGAAWMALELTPGALAGTTGRIEWPAPFLAL